MADRLHLQPRHRRVLEALLREHLPDVEVWAYGSRVNGRSHDGSDLNLVLRGPGLTEISLDQLTSFGRAVREWNIPFLVEACDWASLPERFRRDIEREYVRLRNEDNKCATGDEGTAGELVLPEKPLGRPPWKTASLGEICDLSWGDTNTTKRSYSKLGFTAYSASGPDGLLPHADYERTGVVLSAIGSDCGKTWIAKGKWSCIKNTIRFFSTTDEVETEFLYWVTRDPKYWPTRGSGQPFISQGDARACVIQYPPLPEQRAIAHILGVLDDKIELNRRMNETLEAMAQAIFKDWFVDFGPVRAKLERRTSYLPDEIWALFPGTFQDDAPAAWSYWTLGDLATHHRRTVSPAADPDRLFEHYSIPAFDSGAEPSLDSGASIKSNKTVVPENAVLLSKLNPRKSRVWIPRASRGYQQVASTELLTFTPSSASSRELLYCLFRDGDFRREMVAMVTGTSGSHQRVPPKALISRNGLYGTADMFEQFRRHVSPLLKRVLTSSAEAGSLARTRDTLLPKLISGDIRLGDAWKAVEALP